MTERCQWIKPFLLGLIIEKTQSEYGPRRAAYDLKKLRAKMIVRRITQTRRYESTASGLRQWSRL